MAALGLSATLAGCDSPSAPEPLEYVRAEISWVAGDAAAALDHATGLFRLPLSDQRNITLPLAESIAVAAARFSGEATFGNAREVLEADRGGPIDFLNLSPCWRATHVEAPFGVLPPPAPGWLRRALAPQWAIPLCGRDSRAQLSIGIPDAPTDVRVVDGRLVFRQIGGGFDFVSFGVAVRYPFGLPLTPEEVVAAVFEATSKRIVSVPRAFDQRTEDGLGQIPLCASWMIQIEDPVPARSAATGTIREISEVFVRRDSGCFSNSIAFFAATTDQPRSLWYSFPKDTSGGGASTERDSVEVQVIGAVRFEKVTFVR